MQQAKAQDIYQHSGLDFWPQLINAIHRINHYLVDSVVYFANTYPLDSDLSGG